MLKTILSALVLVVLASPMAHAGVAAYSGLSDEKLYIEAAPKMGKDVYIVKFTGVESEWADKPIKTTKTSGSGGDRYAFDYELELSDGVTKKTYQIVVENGKALVSGSLVPKMELYYKEAPTKPMVFNYDADLTKSSQKVGLADAYKKKAFKPQVY